MHYTQAHTRPGLCFQMPSLFIVVCDDRPQSDSCRSQLISSPPPLLSRLTIKGKESIISPKRHQLFSPASPAPPLPCSRARDHTSATVYKLLNYKYQEYYRG